MWSIIQIQGVSTKSVQLKGTGIFLYHACFIFIITPGEIFTEQNNQNKVLLNKFKMQEKWHTLCWYTLYKQDK